MSLDYEDWLEEQIARKEAEREAREIEWEEDVENELEKENK